ncbi:MAG: response regulator [Gemmatimonadetes bacterium]|nr:response regulator [Gemmatimonadota bacterium]
MALAVTAAGNRSGWPPSGLRALRGRRPERDRAGIPGLLLAVHGPVWSVGPGRDVPGEVDILRGLHVLVVDDADDIRDLLTVVLEFYGASVAAAASGLEALGVLDAQPVDVIVSDIRMPDMDGYSLLSEVRRRKPEEGGAVPAIAITAHGATEDRQRARSAGFQLHFGKPLDNLALVRAIASLTR